MSPMLRLLELLIKAVIFGVRAVISLLITSVIAILMIIMALLVWKFYPLNHLEEFAEDMTETIRLKNIWK